MQAHDVPTHLQAEDRVLLGLTFPQIVAAMAVLGLAYGVWQRAAFLPEGHWRIAAAVTFAILGLAAIVVRPGGRALPAVVLDLLRFALTPKRYGGGIAGLLRPPVEETPTKAQGQTKGKGKAKAKRNKKRWLRAGLPFRLLSFTLAVSVVLASVAPSAAVMAAAPPEDAQRLFIESWTVRGNRAELSLRAATSLTVQVRAQTEDGGESFRARDVLYRGERQTYSVPLKESHRAIAISWNDALVNSDLRVLDRRSFPFPIAPLETSDCTVVLEEIGWKEGEVAGRISGTCESEAEEVVQAVVLTDPDDPTKSVEQRLLLDATVEEVTGSLRLAASGPESGWSSAPGTTGAPGTRWQTGASHSTHAGTVWRLRWPCAAGVPPAVGRSRRSHGRASGAPGPGSWQGTSTTPPPYTPSWRPSHARHARRAAPSSRRSRRTGPGARIPPMAARTAPSTPTHTGASRRGAACSTSSWRWSAGPGGEGVSSTSSGHTFATTPAASPCTPSGHGLRCYSSSATRSPGRACCG